MTSKNTSPVAPNGDKTACADDCACPSNDNAPSALPKRGFLRRLFGKSALCTCSTAGGFLVGHAGCVITPMVMAAVGITTATAGVSLLALSFGAAATAGGLYLWHRLRGQTASKFEKRLVIGSALSGLLISGAMMHLNGHDHHGGEQHQHHNHGAPVEQTTPAHPHHDHSSHGHTQHGQALPPATAAWFAKLDTTQQRNIQNMAQQLDMPLSEYLGSMCITPARPAAGPKPNM